jgi:hypothetical protein
MSLQGEWAEIRKDLRLAAVSRGMLTGASVLVVGTINWAAGAAGILGSLASAVTEYRQIASEISVANRNPLAVLIQLARKDR